MKRALSLLFMFALLALPAVNAAALERRSGVRDRQLVNVTVYNGGMALIHDRRRVLLGEGVNRIAWREVSAQMDESSVLLQALGSNNPVTVLEQNFDFDLLDPSALLNRYVGRMVTVVHPPHFAGQRETRERARLLSTNGGIVLQYGNRIETRLRGYIVYPSAPANFRSPTLYSVLWQYGVRFGSRPHCPRWPYRDLPADAHHRETALAGKTIAYAP